MTHRRLPFLLSLLLSFACECGSSTLGEIKCGDGTCSSTKENCGNCAADCACGPDERCTDTTNLCIAKCGDDSCLAADGENCSTCAADCGCDSVSECTAGQCVTTCGDGTCDPLKNENCDSCVADCGCDANQECAAGTCRAPCGNGTCNANLGENCTTCAADCACSGATPVCRSNTCIAACGDGTCEASRGEDCDKCPSDCGCDSGFECNAGTCESTSTTCNTSVACALTVVHANDLQPSAGAGNCWWPAVGTMSGGDVYVGYGRSNPNGGDDDYAVARLTNSAFTQRTAASNNAYTTGNRHLVQSGTSRLTALYDKTGGGSHVMATRTTDGGGSWATPVQVDKAATSQNASDVAAATDGSTVHVAYRGRAASCPSSGSCYEVFYQNSSDGGATWSDAIRISNDTDQDDKVSIAIDGQNIVIVWVTFDGDVRAARSNNGGRIFSSQRSVNDVAGKARNYGKQAVAVRGSKVHVVWSDERNDSEGDLFIDTSSDGGLTWGADVEIPGNSSRYDETPEIRFAPDGRAWVVWARYASGVGYDIYATATRDGTCFCGGVRINQQTAEDQSNLSFAIDASGKLHVAWRAEVPNTDWAIGYNAATPQ